MTWIKGWNCRGTPGFVTDGADETYLRSSASDPYPVTRNSVTFGWLDSGVDHYDADSGADRRLAGVCYLPGGVTARMQVDLPATGNYKISLALGRIDTDAGNQQVKIYDNTDLLATITGNPGTAEFVDATSTVRSDWPTDNAQVQLAFATTTFIIKLDHPTDYVQFVHLKLEQILGAPIPVLLNQYRQRRA